MQSGLREEIDDGWDKFTRIDFSVWIRVVSVQSMVKHKATTPLVVRELNSRTRALFESITVKEQLVLLIEKEFTSEEITGVRPNPYGLSLLLLVQEK